MNKLQSLTQKRTTEGLQWLYQESVVIELKEHLFYIYSARFQKAFESFMQTYKIEMVSVDTETIDITSYAISLKGLDKLLKLAKIPNIEFYDSHKENTTDKTEKGKGPLRRTR